MKKLLFYFDQSATRIFVEKVDENGDKSMVLSTPKNIVARAEIVARIIDVDNETEIKTLVDPGYDYYQVEDFKNIKIDQGIYFDGEARVYKAANYGFVVYVNGTLKLLSLLSVSRDKIRAFFLIHPTKLGKLPQFSDIEEEMVQNKIMARIPQKEVEEQLKTVHAGEESFAKILVARGKEPVKGHQEYYTPLLSLEKKAGEILADGSINYKEVGSIIQISKNQEILKRFPAVKAVSGYNVYGDKIEPEEETFEGYKKGENIVQCGHDENIFCSSIDGCLVEEYREISVLPVAFINGDVSYESGNIDFNGSVHIKGSVFPGFTVKATGDILVEKTVDDAVIQADGDITIKMGVVGKEAVKIIAGGKLNVKYLLNAKVEAAGEIMVQDSIINCNVFSNDKISVVAKSGKIIGGSSTALHEIIVKVAGAPNETETNLKVGRNLFIERELREIRLEINKIKAGVDETVRLLKVNFGEGVFEDPKKFISILPAVKKKKCLELLKELSTGNKQLKELIDKGNQVQMGLKLQREPVIIIMDKVYPGTNLSIKKSVKKIDSVMTNVKFYEDEEQKIIRFTSAV